MNSIIKEIMSYIKTIFGNDPQLMIFSLVFIGLFIWFGNEIKKQQNDLFKRKNDLKDSRILSYANILNDYRESQLDGNYSSFFKTVYSSINVFDKKLTSNILTILQDEKEDKDKSILISDLISTQLNEQIKTKEDIDNLDRRLFIDLELFILNLLKIISPYVISLATLFGVLLIIIVCTISTSVPEMIIRIFCIVFFCCFFIGTIDLINENKLVKLKLKQIVLGFIFCIATLFSFGISFWIFAFIFIGIVIWMFISNKKGMLN
ncbi:hypothetical protein [Exiguobacterium sp. S22-S28]|uniref:hypothetical protein n=1 Tax=Exiguobacterium sp. S22-S28 TaxID=3342768 RepID=UPI00372D82F9